VRESVATMEKNYKPFHQEEGIIVVQAFIDNLFRRHSVSESPRSMEEDTAPPRSNDTLLLDGMRATRSSSMRFTEPHGCTEEPPVRPHRSTRSSTPPPHTLWYSNGFIIMTEEEEKKLARLERLVANVDFDDQALHILGFHTGHRGWVQFSNGVSVKTHKEFALEIFMTMAHVLDEGVLSLSFRLERAIRTRRPSTN
jgi:hypothetical protein